MWAQISGLASCFFLIVVALFPIGTSQIHDIFSIANQVGMNSFMCFISIAIFLHPSIHKGIGILCFSTTVFNIITMNAFSDLFIAEWIYFALFIIFIILMTANYEKFKLKK